MLGVVIRLPILHVERSVSTRRTMNSITETAVKDIVAAVVGLIPGGKLVEKTATQAATQAFKALTKDRRDAIQLVTDSIVSALTTGANSLSPDDPGRAISAASNVVETIRKAKLDADVLLDCCLDGEAVYHYLIQFPAAGIEYASGGRQALYHAYLKQFAETVVDAVFVTDAFQRRMFRRLMLTQKEMKTMIEQVAAGNRELNHRIEGQ
jgi:hypothetical protein